MNIASVSSLKVWLATSLALTVALVAMGHRSHKKPTSPVAELHWNVAPMNAPCLDQWGGIDDPIRQQCIAPSVPVCYFNDEQNYCTPSK